MTPEERAEQVRKHPTKGDKLSVGGVLWEVVGRGGDLPDAPVVLLVRLGRRKEKRAILARSFRRIARRAAVVVDGRLVEAPPPPPEDPEQVEMFEEGDKA